MIENVMERLLVDRAEKNGWLSKKLSFIGERGAPDRLFVKGGRVMFVELKRPGEIDDTSANQKRVIRQLLEHGAEVYVIDNLKDGYALVEV